MEEDWRLVVNKHFTFLGRIPGTGTAQSEAIQYSMRQSRADFAPQNSIPLTPIFAPKKPVPRFLPPISSAVLCRRLSQFMSSTQTTQSSSSSFESIFDAALADYLDQTGVDLTKGSFTEPLQNCRSAEAILELLQDKASQFKDYRNGNRQLINCLNPVVQVLHAFSGVLGESVSSVRSTALDPLHCFHAAPAGPFPPSKSNF